VRARHLAALVLVLSSARADDGWSVSFRSSVQLRAYSDRNVPDGAIRWDPASGGLALSSYLATQGHESHGSALASLGLDGHHLDGDLRWVLTADTGEVRSERRHRVTSVCWSDQTASGLAVPGSGQCQLYRLSRLRFARVIVPVEDTRLADQAQLTSNGRSFDAEVSHTLLIREAYASYRFGRAGFLSLTIGQRRMVVADGYVHDDYALGVELAADVGAIGPQWNVSAAVFRPSRDLPGKGGDISPMALVRLDYLPSLFERAGIFAAGLRERSDDLATVFGRALEERLVQVADDNAPGTLLHQRAGQLLALSASTPYASEGTLGWLGTSGKLTPWKGQRLAWTAALMGGQIDRVRLGVRDVVLAERVAMRGRMASLRYETDLGDVGLSAWFLYLSGDELPPVRLDANRRVVPFTGVYRGFLGVSPYLTETSLFFGGGLSESYADRQVSTPGVNGRGVVAPGLTLRWDPLEGLSTSARGAWLRAAEAGPFGGRGYGTEIDVNLSWEPREWILLGVEADVLFPGDFFRGRQPMSRGILALDLRTP
jgi:hypothetical protein